MTGRYRAAMPSIKFHQARHLGDLEARARPLYFHDAVFHAKVTVAVRVLDAMFPDADATELSRAALLVLAAVETEVPPRPPSNPAQGGLMDPAAVGALMDNLKGKAPIPYESGHGLNANHNGDPVCVCGWDPVRELPREVVQTWMDGVRQVNAHSRLEAAHGEGTGNVYP